MSLLREYENNSWVRKSTWKNLVLNTFHNLHVNCYQWRIWEILPWVMRNIITSESVSGNIPILHLKHSEIIASINYIKNKMRKSQKSTTIRNYRKNIRKLHPKTWSKTVTSKIKNCLIQTRKNGPLCHKISICNNH